MLHCSTLVRVLFIHTLLHRGVCLLSRLLMTTHTCRDVSVICFGESRCTATTVQLLWSTCRHIVLAIWLAASIIECLLIKWHKLGCHAVSLRHGWRCAWWLPKTVQWSSGTTASRGLYKVGIWWWGVHHRVCCWCQVILCRLKDIGIGHAWRKGLSWCAQGRWVRRARADFGEWHLLQRGHGNIFTFRIFVQSQRTCRIEINNLIGINLLWFQFVICCFKTIPGFLCIRTRFIKSCFIRTDN